MYPAFEQALATQDSAALLRLYTLALDQRAAAEDRNRALISHIVQLKAQSSDERPAAEPKIEPKPAKLAKPTASTTPASRPRKPTSEDLGI